MVTLRAPEPSDLDYLYRLENLPDVRRATWCAGPMSRHMLWQYLQQYTGDILSDKQMRWIISLDGKNVGTVDITEVDSINQHAMIGIAVDPSHMRQGIATEALRQAIDFCRNTLGLHQLCALVAHDNEASLRLFANLGFTSSGCLRSWIRRGSTFVDVTILQLML